jgi:hypothetical protein
MLLADGLGPPRRHFNLSLGRDRLDCATADRCGLAIDSLRRLNMAQKQLPKDVEEQIRRVGLPTAGSMPFYPQLDQNKKGEPIIKKATIRHGPRRGKRGY